MEKEKRMLLSITKALFVLLAVDVIEAVLAGVELVGIFDQMAEYGQIVLVTGIVIVAITVAIALYEILAKVFLIRSSSVLFSQPYGRKGHIIVARLLLLFNAFSVVTSLLSFGGEGATLYSQTRFCIRIVSSLAEITALIFYLRTAKAIRAARRNEKGSAAR